jgi:L-seryl-tRNA(Ser) seleniumtransferase
MSQSRRSGNGGGDSRRALPSVSALLELPAIRELMARAPRPTVVDAIRATLEQVRASGTKPGNEGAWEAAITLQLERAITPSLRPVLNGSGVVLHTNLGRAPLADVAIRALTAVAAGYSNLEYDLDRGARGSRYVHCTSLLRELTGADDALVVNNGAAALVLALNTIARDRGALISRGELVEIGGSFRIPDIIERSGARLVEVGTTNRTHVDDYRRSLGASGEIGAILKVHRSNFALEGFVADASVLELRAIASEAGVAIVHDLGSGLLLPLDKIGLTGEPTARDALRAGATVVTMSGDKLLGGPQAGVIVGDGRVIARMRENPLARSYRVDKLTLAALEATLALYREPERAFREVPVLAMLSVSVSELRRRGDALCAELAGAGVDVQLVDSEASVGGGAFPTARIPSLALAITPAATAFEARLRLGDPPVIGRLLGGKLLIDLRTVLPREDAVLQHTIVAAHGSVS